MQYFTEGYNDFFKGLAANNHKDWFDENRKTYHKEVKDPFYKFLEDLIERIREEYDPKLDLLVKNAVFRINRDIRFSKDKTPYKMNRSAVVSRDGRKSSRPGFYMQVGVGEIWLGGGIYQPNTQEKEQIRDYIAKHPKELDKLLNVMDFKAIYGEMRGEKNKRISKEHTQAAEQQPLLYNKQFYYMAEYDDEGLILQEDFLDWIMKHYAAAKPLQDYLDKALGYDPS